MVFISFSTNLSSCSSWALLTPHSATFFETMLGMSLHTLKHGNSDFAWLDYLVLLFTAALLWGAAWNILCMVPRPWKSREEQRAHELLLRDEVCIALNKVWKVLATRIKMAITSNTSDHQNFEQDMNFGCRLWKHKAKQTKQCSFLLHLKLTSHSPRKSQVSMKLAKELYDNLSDLYLWHSLTIVQVRSCKAVPAFNSDVVKITVNTSDTCSHSKYTAEKNSEKQPLTHEPLRSSIPEFGTSEVRDTGLCVLRDIGLCVLPVAVVLCATDVLKSFRLKAWRRQNYRIQVPVHRITLNILNQKSTEYIHIYIYIWCIPCETSTSWTQPTRDS